MRSNLRLFVLGLISGNQCSDCSDSTQSMLFLKNLEDDVGSDQLTQQLVIFFNLGHSIFVVIASFLGIDLPMLAPCAFTVLLGFGGYILAAILCFCGLFTSARIYLTHLIVFSFCVASTVHEISLPGFGMSSLLLGFLLFPVHEGSYRLFCLVSCLSMFSFRQTARGEACFTEIAELLFHVPRNEIKHDISFHSNVIAATLIVCSTLMFKCF